MKPKDRIKPSILCLLSNWMNAPAQPFSRSALSNGLMSTKQSHYKLNDCVFKAGWKIGWLLSDDPLYKQKRAVWARFGLCCCFQAGFTKLGDSSNMPVYDQPSYTVPLECEWFGATLSSCFVLDCPLVLACPLPPSAPPSHPLCFLSLSLCMKLSNRY